MPIWICLSICLVAVGCNSSGKDEPVETLSDAADSASQKNKEMTEDVARRVQELENEQNKGEKPITDEDIRRFGENPRDIPFGGSKEFEMDLKHLYNPLGGDVHYTNIVFDTPDCLTSAGVSVWFGNVSEGDKSDRLTYWVRVDEPGERGRQVFQDSLSTCKTQILMTLISEGYKTGQKGMTPMLLKLVVSKYGIHVNEPIFVH